MREPADNTAALAAAICDLDRSLVADATLDRAKDLILDALGVMLHGARYDWSRIVREQVAAEAGCGMSTMVGGGRASERGAALANGVAGHAIEFDDTHEASLTHPGCVVISAALAVAEAERRPGLDFLLAVIAGYEAQCRVGKVVGGALIRRGFHPTATTGVFGAAAATGWLTGLAADDMASAFGNAASMASGIMRFSQDPTGTMTKRLHGGLPAGSGVLAARLAGRGLRGPGGAIDGRLGFAEVFAGTDVCGAIADGLGEKFEIDAVSIKLYPCCRNFHALLEALAECRAAAGFDVRAIKRIEVAGPAAMVEQHMIRRPDSVMAAQYSLPYATAAGLLLDPSDPVSFSEDMFRRTDLLALADRVTARIDPELDALFPRHYGGAVTIVFADGSEGRQTVLDCLGSPSRPIGRDRIRQKFEVLTRDVLGATQRQEIMERVAALDSADALDGLMRLVDTAAASPLRDRAGEARLPALKD